MGGLTWAVMLVLALPTIGAHAASEHQNLRHLQTVTRDYKYLGCFKDKGNDRILAKRKLDNKQATEVCYDYCAGLGAPLMGTQYGKECWCATEEADVEGVDYGRHGEGAKCNTPCAGNEDETCGGAFSIDLYSIGRDYVYLGCFKDKGDDRILGKKKLDNKQSTGACYDYCAGLGAPLMGTQFGKECWCTTEANAENVDYGRHGKGAKCNSPCAGNEDETCGGAFSIDLYGIGSQAAPAGALVDDIVKIVPVKGMKNPGGESWADSYSVGGKCYMWTNLDHGIGDFKVDTPVGKMKVSDLQRELGPGPGHKDRPLYNDIQCGNGPANDSPDETKCPGLLEYGPEGCGQIGPKWDLSGLA